MSRLPLVSGRECVKALQRLGSRTRRKLNWCEVVLTLS